MSAPKCCVECKKPVGAVLHAAAYDLPHGYATRQVVGWGGVYCSDACLLRIKCRQGRCEHWSIYECKEFLGIAPVASAEAVAADLADKAQRKAEYEASKK